LSPDSDRSGLNKPAELINLSHQYAVFRWEVSESGGDSIFAYDRPKLGAYQDWAVVVVAVIEAYR